MIFESSTFPPECDLMRRKKKESLEFNWKFSMTMCDFNSEFN